MVGMNVTAYAFTFVSARIVAPHEFGALTALLGIVLVGNVASLGLQAATARRIAVEPEHADQIAMVTTRVTTLIALSVAGLVALSTLVLTPVLHLDTYLPVVLCGASLVPLTIMGAQAGIAQGQSRWALLTRIYLAAGAGRVIGGLGGLAIAPSATWAMAGIAVGSWLPVVVGFRTLIFRGPPGGTLGRRELLREAVLGTHALLAYFVLCNVDSLIARNLFDEHRSGIYASGLILAKAALFFPQFVSVVLYPDLARADGNRARTRAVLIVAGLGAVAVTATAVLPDLALILVGGDQYAEVSSRLWLFALAGSMLAIVNVLVFDALARHAHGIVVILWVSVAAVIGAAYGLSVGISGLVTIVAVVAGVLAISTWFVLPKSRDGALSTPAATER